MKPIIHWHDAETRFVDGPEYEQIRAGLIAEGGHVAELNTSAKEWFSHPLTWKEDTAGSIHELFIARESDFGHDLFIYKMNDKKLARDILFKPIHPSMCKKRISDLFEEITGSTLCKAFKPVDSREFMFCVPKSVYYHDPIYARQEIDGINYADVSSMFPANARGRLPDAHTVIRIEGYAKPTEEYPFAFYLKSHHCAEYGVFDTHDYMKLPNRYFMWQCLTDSGKPIYKTVPDKMEVTVLMKPSEYEMTEVFEQLYKEKLAGDPLAKAIQNIGIGTLHKNPKKSHKEYIMDYYHLAAIILGRSNAKQWKAVREIERGGGLVISLIVDSIIYTGYKQIGGQKKVLGEYYGEFTDVCLRATDSINKYVIYDRNGEILKCVISGIKDPIEIKSPEDIDIYNKE